MTIRATCGHDWPAFGKTSRNPTPASAASVRARFAAAMLGDTGAGDGESEGDAERHPSPARIGDVTLKPHQAAAAAELAVILRKHGGALLADEVGLGKTFTALAVASRFARTAVVAPAALRAMWQAAFERTSVAGSYTTAESLSRSAPTPPASDLVIVDEAHWFRNPDTRRYRELALWCRRSTVLLLSATPLHNRARDLHAVLALFLGPSARWKTPNEIATLIVRRDALNPLVGSLPRVRPTRWRRLGVRRNVLAALQVIATPIAPRGGGVAPALLRLLLLRRLASSHAALRATLRRLLARGLALLAAVRAGRDPAGHELDAWLIGDDAMQLAFAELVVGAAAGPNERASPERIERHLSGIRNALAVLQRERDADADRAAALRDIMRAHGGARIVAFSQFDQTVRALTHALRDSPGVASISGRGARIASGPVSRADVLLQFDATAVQSRATPDAMLLRLLLTTDLLSEGVNLHSASVIVHLDLPWSPARLEQRVGRVARLGSPHTTVHVYGFAPPRPIEADLRGIVRLRAKARAAAVRLGHPSLLRLEPLLGAGRSVRHVSDVPARDALRTIMRAWRSTAPLPRATGERQPVAACLSVRAQPRPLLLALLLRAGDRRLLAATGSGALGDHPRVVLRVTRRLARASVAPYDAAAVRRCTARVERWLERQRAAAIASTESGAPGTVARRCLIQATHAATRVLRSERPHGLQLLAQVRAAVAQARTAGEHATVDAACFGLLQTLPHEPAMDWLARAAQSLSNAVGQQASGLMTSADLADLSVETGNGQQEWSLVALLVGL
ncbi:MAG: helicase-related protein [Gemmatimonadaceae bacterium]